MAIPESDPFSDPPHASNNYGYAESSTLPVGRNASLTLATDSLIVLGTFKLQLVISSIVPDDHTDEDFTRREVGNCCGLIPTGIK